MKKRIWGILLSAVVVMASMTGCSMGEKEDKLRDVDFTVVTKDEMPEEIQQAIEEKKKSEFQMTYTTEEYLYILKGYGTQKSSGYSIQVTDCYLTDKSLIFTSILRGPREGQEVEEKETYPYIIVKTENIDTNVLFQ